MRLLPRRKEQVVASSSSSEVNALNTGSMTPGAATPGMATPAHAGNWPTSAVTEAQHDGGYLNGSMTPTHLPESQSGPVSSADHSSNENSQSLSEQRHNAYEIMAETIFRYARREGLFSDNPNVWNGVALRLSKGKYAYSPQHDPRLQPWISAMALLNCDAAVSITATVVAGITSQLPPGSTEVALSPVDRIQVLETIDELATARKAQCSAFIRTENRLIVWSDKVDDLISVARNVENKMVKYVWERATGAVMPAAVLSSASKDDASSDHESASQNEKSPAAHLGDSPNVRRGAGGEKLVVAKVEGATTDSESLTLFQERMTNLQAPLLHGLGVALNIVVICLMLRTLLTEAFIDNNFVRLAIFAAAPFLFVITLFFSDNIIQGIALLFGPIRQMRMNTRYYSGTAPEHVITGTLPHVTIQMPVYKESLDTVLAPTIESLNRAIRTYELQGGTASILVSEDGMLLVDEEERQKRLDYYDRQQIAWVARPGHNKDGYIRKGRFKKASNLNFTCQISLAVEKYMDEMRPQDTTNWSHLDEDDLYQTALRKALADAHPKAQASGNVRIGDLILLIDCDTRVPEDCFLDAASEMTQCPDVAILQHCSGVMLVTENNYFEKGIGFFTRCVNFAISYTVANGDIAPFMGHNAFLRWSAVQEAAFVDEEDGVKKVWSETTVSEDFDMSLRVLMKGYICRWATYSNDMFKEGVSLTCDDELNRWQKYAFGVSELVFQPFYHWWHRFPITPLWRSYLWAKEVPIHAKFSASSYIFSYYAIGSALPLTVALFLVQGWFAPTLDGAYLPPFNVFVAVVVVFSGLGNVANIIAKFRAQRYTFFEALKEHIIWLPFMVVFFSGLSYHVLTALLSHGLGYDMSWSATNKDLADSNFFLEVPNIIKSYWKQLTACFLIIALVAVLSTGAVPLEWQLHGGFYVIWCPLLLSCCHILYHLALNPQLLRFSF